MPTVVFYEKPGCLTNARQKALLERHGYELAVRNLLTEAWTEGRLYAFLGNRPVTEWFNPAAPAVKSGEIEPRAQDRRSAMALLLRDPLLIRRPLVDTVFGKMAGFDDAAVLRALGIDSDQVEAKHQACASPDVRSPCG